MRDFIFLLLFFGVLLTVSSPAFCRDEDIGGFVKNPYENACENPCCLFRGASPSLGTSSLSSAVSSDGEWRWRTRLAPYASWENYQQQDRFPGFSASTFGFMTDFERHGKRNFFLGFDAGGDWISVHEKDRFLDKNIDAFKMLLRGGMERDQWAFDLGVGYGCQSQDLMQTTNSAKWSGDRYSDQFGFRGVFRIKVSSGLFQMEPFLGFDYLNLKENGYRMEPVYGTSDILTFARNRHESQGGMLGLRYQWRQTGEFVTWYPELSGAWHHEFGDTTLFRSSWIDPFPTVYTVSRYENDKDRLIFGALILGKVGKYMDIFFCYSASIAGGGNIHSIMTGMNWYF